MAHADSIQFAVEEAQALGEPLPQPPQPLDDFLMPIWESIVRSKRRSAWTPADLQIAVRLARDLWTCEQLQKVLDEEGPVLVDSRGKKYPNPIANLIDQGTRRALAAMRQLQIHAVATSGKTDHQRQKNEQARDLADKLNNSHRLLAKPSALN